MEEDDAFNFSTHNETSKENIFTIPMDKNIYTNQFHYLFRYADVLLIKAEAKVRNGGEDNVELNKKLVQNKGYEKSL